MDHCKYPFLRSLLANRKFRSVCTGISKKIVEMDLCFDTVCVLANVYTNPSAGRFRNNAALHLCRPYRIIAALPHLPGKQDLSFHRFSIIP